MWCTCVHGVNVCVYGAYICTCNWWCMECTACFSGAFHFTYTIYTYMHHKHTCAPHASLNTHVHHQTPPKIKIYLVGLPSALYDRPGQNERSVLNQLFLLLLRCFSWKAHEKCTLFTKSAHFSRKALLFERPLARNCNPVFILSQMIMWMGS